MTSMLRFLTSGESHGPGLIAIIDGFPAGLALDLEKVNHELWCRQQGYGRGARQKIESDAVEVLGGLRHGISSGAPLAVLIRNKDWDNWRHVMSASPVDVSDGEVGEQLAKKAIERFRPGHADLSGTLKYRQQDIRDVLERASARETAARVAVGAICQQLLGQFGVNLVAYVTQVGTVKSARTFEGAGFEELARLTADSEMFCPDADATGAMKDHIKSAWQEGDSLGGVVEVQAEGLPVGLGSYAQWDRRLDGQLGQALMSIQAIKAVEIGDGVESSAKPGSQVHDAIFPASDESSVAGLPFKRETNRAGGIEGGMTNGERLRVRAYMKPLPTLRKGLPSVSFPDFNADTAHYERSDVSAIAAASVVCKAMVAFVLARAFLEKFAGDSVTDLRLSFSAYQSYCFSLGPASGSIASHKARADDAAAESGVESE